MKSLELLRHAPAQRNAHVPPLLFLHGAWHGAWCWQDHFLPYFAAHGYACYAMSLRGHGNSPTTKSIVLHTIEDYLDDLAWCSAQVRAECGRAPILIGHSMGGHVLQRYLQRAAPPAVALLGAVPVSGVLSFLLKSLPRHARVVPRMMLTLSAKPIFEQLDDVRYWLFSDDAPAESVAACHARLGDESWLAATQMLLLSGLRPRRYGIPMLVLAPENDRLFTVSEQRLTADAYGADFLAMPDLAHDVMLDVRWQACAAALRAWLARLPLSA
jgi:pimeloyl-ACP methyl ester carboxylesterase